MLSIALAREREFTLVAVLLIAAIAVSGFLGFYVWTLAFGPGKTVTSHD